MKLKFLLSTCALSALFVGCNSEDFLAEVDASKPAAMEEVVGADLVSAGLKIELAGEATTRVNADGWEGTETIGMAWYKLGKNIFDEQTKASWDELKAVSNYDKKIYANDMFFFNCDKEFETKANIYQGAHFLYFPYEYQAQVGERSFDVNETAQTEDFQTELLNKALHVSAQDFISADEVDATGKLTKKFVLAPVVNAIKVVATPEEAIAQNATLSAYPITKLTINANADVFRTSTGAINPSYIPKVVREKSGAIDQEATLKDMSDAAKLNSIFANKEYVKTLSTAIDAADINLSEAQALRAFTLPTSEKAEFSGNPAITVTVGRKDYTLGTFAVNVKNNEAAINKLKAALTDGVNGDKNLTLKNVLRDANGVWQPLNLNVDLLAANFTPATSSIKSVAQWNDLVDLYDALVEIRGKENVTVPTFKLAADVEFENEIKTPVCGVKFNTATGKSMKVKGSVEWPENLEASANTASLIVEKGATLKVNTTLDATIENNGIIEAGALASISTQTSKKLTNNNRIIVEYGAYVYPAEDTEDGVIAYKVVDNNAATMGKINTLIAESGNKEYASVNTLIVSTALDLDAQATAANDDRYNPSTATNLASLAAIDIELENGTIVASKDKNKSVNNVTAVSGDDNQITDIQPASIATAAGATLNVASVTKPKTTLALDGDIVNVGTLKANTSITCANVDNAKGTIYTYDNAITYKETYTQGGTVYGKVNKADAPADPTAALAENVKNAWDAFFADAKKAEKEDSEEASANILKSLDNVARWINENYKEGNTDSTVALFDALNAWWKAKYGEELSATTVSAADFGTFQGATGYQFYLTIEE